MASSEVAICNRALTLLGQPLITSLNDPGRTAETMRLNYPLSRDAVLRGYPWNSATRRASLASSATAPDWGYARAFPLPPDCLRVMDSEGDLIGVRWRVEGRQILTDAGAPLRIRYVAAVTDPALYDPLLSEAIAAHLAMMSAIAVTGSDAAMNRAAGLYQSVVREARGIDAREQSQDEALSATSWLDARVGQY